MLVSTVPVPLIGSWLVAVALATLTRLIGKVKINW
jgi:hypothetical protein